MPRKSKKLIKKRFIGVGSVNISDLEKQYINDALENNRLSYGYYTNRFERAFARAHKVKFALFCNSGTSALQVGLHAMKEKYGWKDGDEVLVPAVTFVASVNVILQNRLKPVLVDVDPVYFEMEPEETVKKITDRTVAMMPVHLCGCPCDMDGLMALKKEHDIKMIEDSCETMFARYKGKPVGSFGEVACFSTYAAHILVTGVGGFAVTDDEELAISIKSLYNHGRDGIYTNPDDTKRGSLNQLFTIVSRRFNFVDVGYSYRATELESALGLGQMHRWRQLIAKRKRNARALTRGLKQFSSYLQLPRKRAEADHVFMMYPMVVGEGVDRDELVLFLEKNGIETRYLLPLTNQPVYERMWGRIDGEYPVAKSLNQNGFYIGCHPDITQKDIEYIVGKFGEFFRKHV
jgi:dTDP-4-amino-4,6-dideoxygalactose transaminase